jgi:hypothetical protein
MKIQPGNITLGELLIRKNLIIVPRYQRDYAWDNDEIHDYIDDIKKLYPTYLEDPSVLPQLAARSPKRHFFGSIVCAEKFWPNSTDKFYEVIDGQQRLATSILLLHKIVNGFKNLAEKALLSTPLDQSASDLAKSYAEQIRTTYLFNNLTINDQPTKVSKLKLNEYDNTVFQGICEGNDIALDHDARESHKRIKNASNILDRSLIQPILKNKIDSIETKIQNLLKLHSCIINDLHIIHLVTHSNEDAYRLFTVLNDRGRSLHTGDLLRTLTLELLEQDTDKQNEAEKKWEKILSGKQSDIEKFLQDYYVSHKGQRAPIREFYDFFKEEFFKVPPTPPLSEENVTIVFNQIAHLENENAYHELIMEGEWPYQDSSVEEWYKNRLFLLTKVLKHTLCVPLLLSAKSSLTEKKFLQIVLILDKFVIRYINVVHNRPAKLEKIYLKYCVQLRKNPESFKIKDFVSELKELIRINAPEDVFIRKLKELEYSKIDSKQNATIRYLLTTINSNYTWFNSGAKGNPKPEKILIFDIINTTIEHIYPDNSNPKDPLLEPYKNKLGNLSIWSPADNQSVANDPYEKKKEKYSHSQIELNREIARLYPVWDSASVIKREISIIDMIVKSFKI